MPAQSLAGGAQFFHNVEDLEGGVTGKTSFPALESSGVDLANELKTSLENSAQFLENLVRLSEDDFLREIGTRVQIPGNFGGISPLPSAPGPEPSQAGIPLGIGGRDPGEGDGEPMGNDPARAALPPGGSSPSAGVGGTPRRHGKQRRSSLQICSEDEIFEEILHEQVDTLENQKMEVESCGLTRPPSLFEGMESSGNLVGVQEPEWLKIISTPLMVAQQGRTVSGGVDNWRT